MQGEGELTAYEREFLYNLRDLNFGTRTSPLPKATIDRLYESIRLVGIDSDLQIQLIKTIKVIREQYHGTGQGDQDADKGTS